MDDLIKSDIFFFVTTLAIIIVTALLVTLLIYAIAIFRKVKKETDEIVNDVSVFRRFVEKFFGKKEKKKKQ